MYKASFFAANLQTSDENEDKAPGQSLTFEAQPAKSFKGVAVSFAKKFGFELTDDGKPVDSSRFSAIQSFGVEGHTQRIFVWSAP